MRIPHLVRNLWACGVALVCCCLFALSIRAQSCPEEIAGKTLNDQKPGSVLFFNKYTSLPLRELEDTLITITNTHTLSDIDVHLFFVDGATGNVADAFLTLAPNQTRTFLASDVDPGVEGYIMAVACFAGVPTGFNFLTGEAAIYERDGFEATLPAMAVGCRSRGDLELNDDYVTATLRFDGCQYERLPQSLALPNFNSQIVYQTYFTLLAPKNDFTQAGTNGTKLTVTVFDDRARTRTANLSMRGFRQTALGDLRLGAELNQLVEAGRTGWMKFVAEEGRAILGATFNKGPRFKGGRNLATLSLLKSFNITVPAEAPVG